MQFFFQSHPFLLRQILSVFLKLCIDKNFSRTFIEGEFKNFTSYLRTIHAIHTSGKVNGTPLMCTQNGCRETFHSFPNFWNHLLRCSRTARTRRRKNTSQCTENPLFENPVRCFCYRWNSPWNVEMLNALDVVAKNKETENKLKINLAKFLLNLRSHHLV